MKTEVAMENLNFDSTSSSPYMTAPSSPLRFQDFEFNFSSPQLDQISDAQDLFHGGKIKLQPIINRGRDRSISSTGYNVRKGTRSMSPPLTVRISDIILEDDDEAENMVTRNSRSYSILEDDDEAENMVTRNSRSYSISSFLSAINKKWKFNLFRSASEGHSITKYAALTKKEAENSSFRLIGSSSSVSSFRKISAHEMHYTANRAISEEMRRKTFLPYKQGLLGCLGFNHHDRIGSLPCRI